MAGNLSDMAGDWATALINPLPSDGSTSPLRVKTSILWSEKRLASNSSHTLLFNWEQSGLGLALNMIALESPTLSVSTDPVMQLTTNLTEFLGRLTTYGMPYLFRCTGTIIAWKVALITFPLRLTLFNQDDSDDSILLIDE